MHGCVLAVFGGASLQPCILPPCVLTSLWHLCDPLEKQPIAAHAYHASIQLETTHALTQHLYAKILKMTLSRFTDFCYSGDATQSPKGAHHYLILSCVRKSMEYLFASSMCTPAELSICADV